MPTRLEQRYKKRIVPTLMKQFGYRNVHQVPRLVQVTVNVGTGRTAKDAKLQEVMLDSMRRLTGQQPATRRAKKSIASFKVRQGQSVGLTTTLRGARMQEFIDKLVNITLPRVRDFRGLNPHSFDGHGNYSLGLKEQTVFPEVPFEMVEKTHGLEITVTTSARTDKEARALLDAIGFPFAKGDLEAEEEVTTSDDRASLRAYARAKAEKTAVTKPAED